MQTIELTERNFICGDVVSGTPRVQCHGKIEAKKLEEILTQIKSGALIDRIIQSGSVVYVHLKGGN